ncbi:hypothetical protein [Nonomuraea roseoviolacea]|uniref:Uncharacterized protein n=1 Tax=Nonomuraea roseoviolacea subsp. carminata TaxID=160689 RepID=A0ABT1JRN5_9ACTN|nr:hypothetical protein [Nonomuraea roseoviolacea]MCP2343989.1 hypothetical protein [Nonomuraea roseoviolacea subsp. carminata]
MPILDGLVLPRGWRISSRLLAAWPIDGEHSLELWPTAPTGDGRLRWRYRLSRKSRTVFTASDVSSAVGAMLTIYAMDDVCGYCGAEHLSPGCPTRPLKA